MSQPNSNPHQTDRAPVFTGPTFLMCSPKLYDVNYVINPWMEGNVRVPRARMQQPSGSNCIERWPKLRGSCSWSRSLAGRTWFSPPTPGWCERESWPSAVFFTRNGKVRSRIFASGLPTLDSMSARCPRQLRLKVRAMRCLRLMVRGSGQGMECGPCSPATAISRICGESKSSHCDSRTRASITLIPVSVRCTTDIFCTSRRV